MTPSLFKRLGSVGHALLSPSAAHSRATACLGVLIGLVACDGSRSAKRIDAGHGADAAEELTEPAESEEASPDAALSAEAGDAELAPDAATPTDASPSADAISQADAAPPTLTPIPCKETCTDSQVCIDGRCLFHCGADVEALRATLAPSLKVHWTMCKSDAVVQIVPRDSVAELHVKDGITLSVGYRSDTTDPFSGGIERTPVLSPGAALIPSPFLALANNGPLVFGYTTSAPGAPGALYVSPNIGPADRVFFELSAPGNRAATLAKTPSEMRADHFFVVADGLGAVNEGRAVYRGNFDGSAPSLALRGAGLPMSVAMGGLFDEHLLVSALPAEATWPDEVEGPRVFAIPLSELLGAPVDVFTHPKVARFSGLPSELEPGLQVGTAFITRNPGANTIATVDVRDFVTNWGPPKFSAPVRWVTGGSFTSFTRAGYGMVLLRHGHGTWFVMPR